MRRPAGRVRTLWAGTVWVRTLWVGTVWVSTFLGVLLWTSCLPADETEHGSIALEVETVQPHYRSNRPGVRVFGTIEPTNETVLSAPIEGRVAQVFVDESDTVVAGEVLLVLDNTQLEARLRQAQSELRRSMSTVELAQARLGEARRSVVQHIAQMGLLAMEVGRSEFDRERQAERLAEIEQLFEAGGASSSEVRAEYVALQRADQNRARAAEELSVFAAAIEHGGDLIEPVEQSAGGRTAPIDEYILEENTRTEQAELAVARARVEAAQAEVSATEHLTGDLTVRAPDSGTIAQRHAEQSEYVAAGERLLTIFDDRSMHAVLPVSALELGSLRRDAEVELFVPGVDAPGVDAPGVDVPGVDAPGVDSQGVEASRRTGTIERISSGVEAASGNVRIRVLLENRDGRLRPGLYTHGTVFTDSEKRLIAIPERAIIQGTGGPPHVWVVERSRAFRRTVETGMRFDDGAIEVTEGISVDESVVADPSPFLKHGDEVVAQD